MSKIPLDTWSCAELQAREMLAIEDPNNGDIFFLKNIWKIEQYAPENEKYMYRLYSTKVGKNLIDDDGTLYTLENAVKVIQWHITNPRDKKYSYEIFYKDGSSIEFPSKRFRMMDMYENAYVEIHTIESCLSNLIRSLQCM